MSDTMQHMSEVVRFFGGASEFGVEGNGDDYRAWVKYKGLRFDWSAKTASDAAKGLHGRTVARLLSRDPLALAFSAATSGVVGVADKHVITLPPGELVLGKADVEPATSAQPEVSRFATDRGREAFILEAVGYGHQTLAEIADLMPLSPDTVRVHVKFLVSAKKLNRVPKSWPYRYTLAKQWKGLNGRAYDALCVLRDAGRDGITSADARDALDLSPQLWNQLSNRLSERGLIRREGKQSRYGRWFYTP